MNISSNETEKKAISYKKVGRETEVTALRTLETDQQTQQEVADQIRVPRTTLQHWLYRKRSMSDQIDPEVVAFCESPEGLAFLHQITTAALYTFHKMSGSGLHTIQTFLKLSQINQFIGCSIGSLQKESNNMDGNLTLFGTEEIDRLAANMKNKKISLVGDETFLPGAMILVMMDPVSNFILSEEIREKRDAATWNEVTAPILKKLNVEVIQLSGDEGSGLTSFVLNTLGVHKASDLFHVQQDITKSVGGHLARAENSSKKSLKELEEKKQKAYDRARKVLMESSDNSQKCLDKVSKEAKKIGNCENLIKTAESKIQKAAEDREIISSERKHIGDLYHPIDLETGKDRTPDELEKALNESYDKIEAVLESNGCSDKQKKRLAKSRKMISSLKKTLTFFWYSIAAIVSGMNLGLELECVFYKQLLPLSYLRLRLGRCRDKNQKISLEKIIESIEITLNSRDGPWNNLSQERKKELMAKGRECAEIFQRSSSCVEGRNGFLALLHHGHKRLSAQRLRVLTIIHNFGITRKDGTTAAERLFGEKPRDLFDYLLENTNWPIRPRRSSWSKLRRLSAKTEAA